MKTVVIATGIEAFLENRILDAAIMSRYPGGPALQRMASSLELGGFEVVTSDVYLRRTNTAPALLVTDIGGFPRDIERLERSTRPCVMFCLESPLIAHRVFHNWRRVAARYKHVFTWGGVGKALKGTAVDFQSLYWPTEKRDVDESVPWQDRRFLVLVSSNKRAHRWTPRSILWRHPRQSARVACSAVLARFYRRTDPWMRAELYIDRLQAIGYFAKRSDFDLWGDGWDNPAHGTLGYERQISAAYRGPVEYENKHEVLRNSKFVLALENTIFPGYITEKIFDAFFAGAIPIYLGAPDIGEFVPPDSFVDLRDFSSHAELESYLDGLTPEEIRGYRDAAATFVRSDAFKFTQEEFASRITSWVRAC